MIKSLKELILLNYVISTLECIFSLKLIVNAERDQQMFFVSIGKKIKGISEIAMY